MSTRCLYCLFLGIFVSVIGHAMVQLYEGNQLDNDPIQPIRYEEAVEFEIDDLESASHEDLCREVAILRVRVKMLEALHSPDNLHTLE